MQGNITEDEEKKREAYVKEKRREKQRAAGKNITKEIEKKSLKSKRNGTKKTKRNTTHIKNSTKE